MQTRTFAYNSLSRLTSAANPESGMINYLYDNNGNLTSKTDARGVKTDYIYDALSRVKNRNYSTPNGTPGTGILANYQPSPNVTYFYDGANVAGGIANGKGKLTKIASSVSTTEYTEFDILGRVKAHKQTTDSNAYTTGYTYNLSGALIEETYPSGRVVKNTLDQDGSLQQVQSRRSNDTLRNYANAFTYNAAGAVTALRLGNGKWETTQFNSRLQPTQIGLGTGSATTNKLDLDYTYGTTQNNGNVLGQTITVNRAGQSPLVFNQTYTYDELNRLKIAEEKTGTTTNWKQTFTFDRYGNRNFNQSQTTSPAFGNPNITNPSVNLSNNKFTSGQGYAYDSAGNVITDADGRSFTYDSENKQISASGSSGTIGQYYFDGDGKRVKKIVPSTGETTIFVYDAGGKMVAEYSTVVQPTSNAKFQYLTNDNLGTPRINTDATGNIVSRSDYMPYGEEIVALGGRSATDKYVADDVRQGFTGYENDSETGLDYGQARMYVNRLGRYHSVDPILMNSKRVVDPQQINRYVYVRNNPLKYIDLLGEDLFLANANARQSVNRLFGGMTAAERNRIVVSKDGQVTIKPCASCTGTPSSAFKVVSDAVSANYDIRLSLLKPGESIKIADGTTVSYQTVADARGQAYEFTDKNWDVLIPDGTFDLDGPLVTTNVATMTPHEIAHAVKQDAVTVENAVRGDLNLRPRDPDKHIERDHKTGGIRQTATVMAEQELIEIKDTPLPNIPIQPRPIQPLPTPPPKKPGEQE